MTEMDVEKLRALDAAATSGPWEVDTAKSEGEYGVGPDTHEGYQVSVMLREDGKALFDAHNSDVIEVHEETDPDDLYVHAWDQTSVNDFALLAYLRNSVPAILALVEERDSLREALESIRLYANDTLSGRADGPADKKWHRDGIIELRNRARAALTTANTEKGEGQ